MEMIKMIGIILIILIDLIIRIISLRRRGVQIAVFVAAPTAGEIAVPPSVYGWHRW
jgi:hypothetical protein